MCSQWIWAVRIGGEILRKLRMTAGAGKIRMVRFGAGVEVIGWVVLGDRPVAHTDQAGEDRIR